MNFSTNKKALSPLVATALLVIFALVLGAITMNWGKSYIQAIESKEKPATDVSKATIVIPLADIDTPLKQLQIDYIIGKISKEEYLEREKELI
jgi:flagellin-like protein